ncbi:MAG: hypothetical protein GY820_44305 [Gammaproteobacteria bacterium]|nr:hypothetical protein [Gammaproteobacteria bacterium]
MRSNAGAGAVAPECVKCTVVLSKAWGIQRHMKGAPLARIMLCLRALQKRHLPMVGALSIYVHTPVTHVSRTKTESERNWLRKLTTLAVLTEEFEFGRASGYGNSAFRWQSERLI